jgi:hypothetical protein
MFPPFIEQCTMDRLPDSDSKVIFPNQWHNRPDNASHEHGTVQNSVKQTMPFIAKGNTDSQLPAISPAAPPRPPLVPERSDFFEGDAPAADKVKAFLTRALEASDESATVAGALVPWICDALLSNHSVKAYGRDFMDFVRHMQAQGVTPLDVTADHVKLYKRGLLEAGMASATVARRLSVLRGAYGQLAAVLEIHATDPTLTLLSADAELNAAALPEGLTVEDPNSHP